MKAPRSDAARNAERILNAARELFTAEGTGVALDRIARQAGVGNATLYRNYPTRSDLLVAVYTQEVDELVQYGEALLDSDAPIDALFVWLEALIRHMSDKRLLATTASERDADLRSELFDRWHAQMLATLDALRESASQTQRLNDVSARDLAALANGLALAAVDDDQVVRLLAIVRSGLVRT